MPQIKTALLSIFAVLSVTLPAVAQTPLSVTVNGNEMAFPGQPPVRQNGRVLVPLRGVLEKIGAVVRFSGPTKTIQATRGETQITLTLGENQATVDGKSVRLDVPARALNGTTLVPLRFVAESLGADVRFDGAAGMVAIRTDGQPNVITKPKAVAGTSKPVTPGKTSIFTGIFVDFASRNEGSYTLKMTDGRTLILPNDAELLYNGKSIGFDDLRSGDQVVAAVNSNGKSTRAVISDDEGS